MSGLSQQALQRSLCPGERLDVGLGRSGGPGTRPNNPACEASPLGAVVTLEPLDHGGTQEVMAHTSVLVPEPCPSRLEVACEGTDCNTHVTSDPISGQYPSPGWCLWQWQSVVPFRHTSRQILGSTDVVLSSWADLSVRPDNQKVNQPPTAALLPPLRVSVNCFQKFNLSVKDLDGDRVRCRYGNAEREECQICSRHEFLQLDEISCVLVYNGLGETGQYIVELMVEDFLNDTNGENRALSSIPLQLSLTVGEAASCQALPKFTERTPAGGAQFTVLPYDEVDFTVEALPPSGRVSEIAIVGPPGLFASALERGEPGSLASVNTAWLRSPNELPRLLPVCFTANTQSLQSEIRCVWIKQKPVDSLPRGTVLLCGSAEMNFSFPISAVPGLPLSDLRLNDPSCPVSHNDTHVTGRVSLAGCGTKATHSGSELVYTNTLRTPPPAQPISRLPSLELQLSCRFPAARPGPRYRMGPVDAEETFGRPAFWMEFHRPGTGPRQRDPGPPAEERAGPPPLLRHPSGPGRAEGVLLRGVADRRLQEDVPSGAGRVSVTAFWRGLPFESVPFAAQNGVRRCGRTAFDRCVTGNSVQKKDTRRDTVKIYRIDLNSVVTQKNTMYVECAVLLCIAMLPSQKCPDECRSSGTRSLVSSVSTHTHRIRSGAVYVGDGKAPATTAKTTTKTTKSRAPERSFLVVGVALGVVRMLLQTLLL
ncbi:hypothetical protein ANANG_G00210530 [Anguilla anguilla]|uniref:ZP domain-containing protein n=1 Tax=Anguilla anguilla TaxID=7936 RepID=A0A9D3LZM1_ANGAN|nr:hypothetical protein ANANG_G00210530 [Anguilla anguilla]